MSQRIAIALVCRGPQVLVGLRPPDVPLGGYWEFPGGKVEAGERPEEAAVRECREESQLDVRVDAEYARVEHVYAHGTLDLHFFLCSPLGDAASPCPPYRWVEIAELSELRFPPANAEVVRRLVEAARREDSRM